MLRTLEEMVEDESLCNYCQCTNYGEINPYSYTPNGFVSCEGMHCDLAYDSYLDENNTTENIIKYAICVKLLNKEVLDE